MPASPYSCNAGRRRARVLLFVPTWLVVLATAGSWSAAATHGRLGPAVTDPTVVTYTTDNSAIANPERGFYHHTGNCDDDAFDPADLAAYRTAEHINLVMCIFYLHGLTDQAIPAATLAFFEQQAQAVRQAGLKMIVRFAYTSVDDADAPLPRVLAHLDQLAPVLQRNADVIDAVQSGFVGRWGEGYYTQNYGNAGDVSPLDWANRQAIVDKLLDVLPSTRMVQVRTPQMKWRVYGWTAVSPSQAYGGSDIARVGHHNDCFLASPTDQGTYTDPDQEYPYLAADTRYVAMGGETCAANSPRSDCPTALAELAQFHYGYLNRDYRPQVLQRWADQGCLSQVEQRLGYRFSLVRGQFQRSVNRGGALVVQFSVRNLGFSTPSNPRPVWLVLRRTTPTKATFRVRLNTDPRRWAAGTTTVVSQSIPIAATAPTGTFEILLSLPDPQGALEARSPYAIRMANVGTWEPSTGLNKLRAAVLVQ